MSTEALDEHVRLGYVSVIQMEGGYVGGYLCIDKHGVPVEFRYSEPTQPTSMQRLMYGRCLAPQLKGRTIAGGLLQAAGETPSCVFTDDDDVYEGLQDTAQAVCLLGRQGPVHGDPSGCAQAEHNVKAHTGLTEEQLSSCLSSLGTEIAEPFERIGKLLDELQRQGWSSAEG